MENGVVPYRVLSAEERARFKALAESRGSEADEVWKSTRAEAERLVCRLREGGYDVGRPFFWGDDHSGYGESAPIELELNDQRHRIGTVALWEFGGLSEEPVRVARELTSEGQIEAVGSFRYFLKREGIPHSFSLERVTSSPLREYALGILA